MSALLSWPLAGIVFGLVVGLLTARSSARRDPIYGGVPAKLMHYLMASVVTAMPVTIITTIITAGIRNAIIVFIALTIVLWTSALIFATIEKPVRTSQLARKSERGWTEEDARTSGL